MKTSPGLDERIKASLVGAAAGAELAYSRWIHPDWFKAAEPSAVPRLPLRPAGKHKEEHGRLMAFPFRPLVELGVDAYIRKNGRVMPEDFAPLFAASRAIAYPSFALDSLHTTQEVLKEGMHPRISGMGNAPCGIVSAMMPAVGIYHFADAEHAYLDGVELADSLTWDAHKLMRTPGLCTALLVRDAKTLDTAFHQDASYLFHSKQQPGFDSLHRTVECTKAALGLRLFVVLAALGERGLAGYVDRQFDLTLQAYELFRNVPGLECPVEPQCNILCFRAPGDDAVHLRVRDKLLADGDFHLSTAVVGDRRFLRIVVTSPETKLADLRRLACRTLELAETDKA